jgi:hypothetical protein
MQLTRWGNDYHEAKKGGTGQLYDLCRSHRFADALKWIRSHDVNENTKAEFIRGLYWCIIGGLVKVEFIEELLDNFTREEEQAILMKQSESGITCLRSAVGWSASPEVVHLIASRCPAALTVKDGAGRDPLACARYNSRTPNNPRNPNEKRNDAANIILLERLIYLNEIRLQQRAVHLSVKRQQKAPTVVSIHDTKLVDLLIRIDALELLSLVTPFVGPNQQAYNDKWWRDELISTTRKLVNLEVSQENLGGFQGEIIATQAETIAMQAKTIEALSESLEKLFERMSA